MDQHLTSRFVFRGVGAAAFLAALLALSACSSEDEGDYEGDGVGVSDGAGDTGGSAPGSGAGGDSGNGGRGGDSAGDDGRGSDPPTGDGNANTVTDIATRGASAAADTASALSDEICAEGNAVSGRAGAQVVFLVDGSTSMQEGYGNTTRWGAMREAIVGSDNAVVRTMEGLIEFGLVVYSGPMGFGECPIPGEVVGPELNNYRAVERAFPRLQPGVFTPTGRALELVCEALPGRGGGIRPQYVVLATDGEPNGCDVPADQMTNPPVDYQSVIDAANQCCAAGVTIYVVSLASGGAEYQEHLQQIANIGACNGSSSGATVYSPEDPGSLANDLGMLMGTALNCDVLLNGQVAEGKECNGSRVTLNGQTLGCNDADGWMLAEPNLIRLQGDACERFKNNPNAQVSATFPCEIFVPGEGDPGGDDPGGGDPGGDEPGGGDPTRSPNEPIF